MKLIKPFLMLLISTSLFFTANAGNKNGNNNIKKEKPPKEKGKVPIDGGISLLLAAGIGYGVKRVSDKNKKGSPKTQL